MNLRLSFCVAIILIVQVGFATGRAEQTSKAPAGVIIRADEGESFFSADGQRAFLLKVGPANTGSTHLVFGSATLAPGARTPTHRHDRDEEVVFVQKGQVTVTLGDRQEVAEAGGTIYVPPGTWMAIENTGTEPATIVGGMPHAEMEECFRRHIGQRIGPGDPRWPEVNRLCQITYAGAEPEPAAEPAGTAGKAKSAGVVVGAGEGERLPFRDGKVLFLKVGPQSTGSTHTVIGAEDMPPGTRIPVHRHDRDEEVIFVHKGNVTVTLGEQQVEAGAGDTVYIPRGTWIGVENTGKEVATILAVFAHRDMEECFRRLVRSTEEAWPEVSRFCQMTRK